MSFLENTVGGVVAWYKWSQTSRDEGGFADPRVNDWPLMSSPIPTLVLCALYLLTIFLGNKFMESRKPFEIRWLVVLHNASLVALSFYMFAEIGRQMYIHHYRPFCNAVDYSDEGLGMARVLYIYYLSKVPEFMDTVIMVLKKKTNQITFLHLYHHCTIFAFWWMGMKWVAGGESAHSAFLNSFVHVWMYGYYALAAMGIQPWWKKYITQMQMIQFLLNIGHAITSLLQPSDTCPFPRWMGYCNITYALSLFALFMNFYLRSYRPQKQLEKQGTSVSTRTRASRKAKKAE
eukprot:TRINITY_DN1085_c0_g2_i1.p1 TRINITY_DN1085_c0_g2~~TRINITY_DN1085_c0_g2_i1.p1  ORF type:complete len:290 (-),score=72.58 TRINITY_DN1085_c0_g2_i1:249-1118(-)